MGFIYRLVESLQPAPMWIFMSRKDLLGGVFKDEFDRGFRMFMKSFMDWSCMVVPSKIREMSSTNLFQKGIAKIKASRMVSY